jgi:hypothetical protein
MSDENITIEIEQPPVVEDPVVEPEPVVEDPVVVPEPEPVVVPEPEPVVVPEPEPVVVPEPEPEPVVVPEPEPVVVPEPEPVVVPEPEPVVVPEPEPVVVPVEEPVIQPYPSIVFIVPYRDRAQQYDFFSVHMDKILTDLPKPSYRILYIHQCDTREFNRGAMKNIGFLTVKSLYPENYKNITLVFNDIDTMPYTKGFLNYETMHGMIKHFYGFTFTLGGIVSIKASDFEKINGFPNLWSWGYEDNLLQIRANEAGLIIDRNQFYPFLDKNILFLTHGLTRNVNRSEFDVYMGKTVEGINTIYDLQYSIDERDFVNVTQFNTNRVENVETKIVHDLRKGNQPFNLPVKQQTKRRSLMPMFMEKF